MGMHVHASTKEHLFSSSVSLYLSILDSNEQPVTGESPTIAIRRSSDGFFFDGTNFVDTSGVPTNLSLTEIDTTAVPGLYKYSLSDPGPVVPSPPAIQLSKDIYEIRFANSGTPPVGGVLYDVRRFSRQLRDINTQGS